MTFVWNEMGTRRLMELKGMDGAIKIPTNGVSTGQIQDLELIWAMETALDLGYRLIDTNPIYGNEHIVGSVIAERIKRKKIKREDLFVIAKFPGSMVPHYEKLKDYFLTSLKNLQLDYIDMYVIQGPIGQQLREAQGVTDPAAPGIYEQDILGLLRTWKRIEEFHLQRKVRCLGVANFDFKQIKQILSVGRIPIVMHQIECNAYFPMHAMTEACRQKNISITTTTPFDFAGPPEFANCPKEDPRKDEIVTTIATRLRRTPSQVLIRHLIQRGFAVLAKASNPAELKENSKVYEFELEYADMVAIGNMGKRPPPPPPKVNRFLNKK